MMLDAGGLDDGPLQPGCPRCQASVHASGPTVDCPVHGPVPTLWRPATASYDAFGAALLAADSFPVYLPWPLHPGWRVSDFAVVVADPGRVRATMTCCSGSSELDGPVDAMIVAEEPGTGLGARVSRLPGDDPGAEVGRGRAAGHLRVGPQPVALWTVSTSLADPDFDRSVFVGEAFGRWLWLVLHPASAMLLLQDEWLLRDVSGMGPQLVELSFGGPAPAW
jgi:hypothetical protein